MLSCGGINNAHLFQKMQESLTFDTELFCFVVVIYADGIAEGGVSRKEMEEKIRRLEKENKRLEMEREILKKAAAFFAKESQ